jgi:hypothetical protein
MTVQGTDNKTCYVFDDFNRLRYVLPPLAVDGLNNGLYADNNTVLEQYAYIYKYDELGNQIYKRIAGCEPIYMVYDKANRLVLLQDGNQRTNNQNLWTATTYDDFGRVLYTAQIVDARTHSDLIAYYKTKIIKEATDSYVAFGYTKVNFPNVDNSNLLIVNYYDEYSNIASYTSSLQYVDLPDYDNMYNNAKTLLVG